MSLGFTLARMISLAKNFDNAAAAGSLVASRIAAHGD
jgi:hypothetical protein